MNRIKNMRTMDRNGLGEVFEPRYAPRTTQYETRKRFKPAAQPIVIQHQPNSEHN